MIEIISKNVVAVVKCSDCQTELSYESEDVDIGQFGCAYIVCPVCGERVYLEDEKYGMRITYQNLKYPQHFASFGNGKHLNDDEVRACISTVLESLQNGAVPVGEFTMSGTGDTLVIGLRYKDEDEIIITKNRETVIIPLASE